VLNEYLNENGIEHEFSSEYHPEQNGVVERANGYLLGCARALLADAGLSAWGLQYALKTAAYLHNRRPMRILDGKTPHELHFGTVPNVNHLRRFGSLCMVRICGQKSKLGPRSVEGMMIGYGARDREYLILTKDSNEVIKSMAVWFPTNEEDARDQLDAREAVQQHRKNWTQPVDVEESDGDIFVDNEFADFEDGSHAGISDSPSQPRRNPPRAARSEGQKRQLLADANGREIDEGCEIPIDESGRVVAMIAGPMGVGKRETVNIAAYVEADAAEIASHNRLQTYEVVPKPTGKRLLGAFMHRIAKHRADGAFVKYKSRLVINGKTQVQGMDFHKSYAPVVGMSSLRVFLAESSRTKKIIHTIDIGTAFLNADVSEELYAVIPRELRNVGDHRTHCLRLKKSIYGLRQAARDWYTLLRRELQSLGWHQLKADAGIYSREIDGKQCFLAVYVDDIIIAADTLEVVSIIKSEIRQRFEIKDNGECQEVLGMCVSQNREEGWVAIDLSGRKLAFLEEEFPGSRAKARTPMSPGLVLPPKVPHASVAEVARYRRILGHLLYFARAMHPEMLYAVCRLAEFQTGPSREHFDALEKVCRYLRYVSDAKLVLRCQDKTLKVYSDADLAGTPESSRSTSGYVIFMGEAAVDFASKRQAKTVRSTAAAEVSAVGLASTALMDIMALIKELRGEECIKPVRILCDNMATVYNIGNGRTPPCERHIWLQHNIALETEERGDSKVEHVGTKMNTADVFTKALPAQDLARHRDGLGVKCRLNLGETVDT
jgi:hypothetical protein